MGLCREACGILVSWPGIEPGPWQWKYRALTTGPPGNSLSLLFKTFIYNLKHKVLWWGKREICGSIMKHWSLFVLETLTCLFLTFNSKTIQSQEGIIWAEKRGCKNLLYLDRDLGYTDLSSVSTQVMST